MYTHESESATVWVEYVVETANLHMVIRAQIEHIDAIGEIDQIVRVPRNNRNNNRNNRTCNALRIAIV